MAHAREPLSAKATSGGGDRLARPSASKHYSREYASLLRNYNGRPLDVSFRELVGPLPANEYTHGLFPYPARLLRHIPRFLLSTDAIVADIDTVFDPFVGSGTVLLEAQLRGFASIGVEQNPVAALISRVKTSQGPFTHVAALLEEVLADAKRRRRVLDPSPMLRRWYSAEAMSALGRLAGVIADRDERDRDILHLCLALTARRMATTDPRIPVPVKNLRNVTASASQVWSQWALESVSIVAKLTSLPGRRPSAEVRTGDAREPAVWPGAEQASRTLMLSSPPYGAAQKYVRSTSLEAAWLGQAPRGKTIHLERGSIGREHLSPLDLELSLSSVSSPLLQQALSDIGERDARRGAIYLAYFADMQRIFTNARESGVGRIALITGDNQVAGGALNTSQHLADLVQALGYRRAVSLRDPIRGRALLTSRKNGTPAPAEYIEIFEMATND